MASPQPTPAPALPELEGLLRLSSKRTHSLYLASSSFSLPADPISTAAGQRSKIVDEYRDSVVLPPSLAGAGAKRAKVENGPAKAGRLMLEGGSAGGTTNGRAAEAGPSQELVSYRHSQGLNAEGGANQSRLSKELMRRKEAREVVPEYHPQCASSSCTACIALVSSRLLRCLQPKVVALALLDGIQGSRSLPASRARIMPDARCIACPS